MASRPPMFARDSSGRNVSLLNDEPPAKRPVIYRPVLFDRETKLRANSYISDISTPSTPSLFRSDSYDSQATNNDPLSPITPTSTYEYNNQPYYGNVNAPLEGTHLDQRPDSHSRLAIYATKRHSSGADMRTNTADEFSASFEEDRSIERPANGAKRYPCRFKDSHGCDKTFTTSGHASRHSKIHTAEKAVQCSFLGCQKKFTRADNMKQHLETHYKERSRSSTSSSKPSSGIKKASASRTSRPNSRTELRRHSSGEYASSYPAPGSDAYAGSSYSVSPTYSYSALDMGSFDKDLPPQDEDGPAPCTGLDALVVAAYQVSR